MGLRYIQPDELHGARSFFTGLDYLTLKGKRNREAVFRDVERQLKLLLLTKNTVSIPASHMANPHAFDFFRERPELLKLGLVVPALRRDKEHIYSYSGRYRYGRKQKADLRAFYGEAVGKVISWELIPNAKRFQAMVVGALRDGKSVLRANLHTVPPDEISLLAEDIEVLPGLERAFITKRIRQWPFNDRRTTINFLNLLYHRSGASTINCESFLPQESYIDYSHDDFAAQRTNLSDTQVFLKLFMEELLLLTGCPPILESELDLLTFRDISQMRQRLQEEDFMGTYDRFMAQLAAGVETVASREGEPLQFDDLGTLLAMGERIAGAVEETVEMERKPFYVAQAERSLAHTRNAMAMDGTAALPVPILSNVASAVSFARKAPEYLVGLRVCTDLKKGADIAGTVAAYRARKIEEYIRKHPFDQRSLFLDALAMIRGVIERRRAIGLSP